MFFLLYNYDTTMRIIVPGTTMRIIFDLRDSIRYAPEISPFASLRILEIFLLTLTLRVQISSHKRRRYVGHLRVIGVSFVKIAWNFDLTKFDGCQTGVGRFV